MDIQRAIHILQDCGDAAKGTEFEQVYRMGAAALQEQAERKKGCEYCNNEKDFEIYLVGEKVGIAYMHKCSDGWGLFLQMDRGDTYYIDIANCPKCGRRLK